MKSRPKGSMRQDLKKDVSEDDLDSKSRSHGQLKVLKI